MDFGDTQLIFEVRGLKTERLPRRRRSATSSTSRRASIAGGKFYPKGKTDKAGEPLPKTKAGQPARAGQAATSATSSPPSAAARSTTSTPTSSKGHYSSALCHLANISYRLGEPVPFNPQTKAFGDNKDAYETLARMEEHLKENERQPRRPRSTGSAAS